VQNRFFTVYYQRVPCVISALKTNNIFSLSAIEIYNFAFAFITPLRSDYDHIPVFFAHVLSMPCRGFESKVFDY
jgi:hypothetical protein